jgi:hypothetical protein
MIDSVITATGGGLPAAKPTRFSKRVRLPCLHVTKETIEQLEKYSARYILQETELDDVSKQVGSILIKDAHGEEKLESIDQFFSLKLRDHTESVTYLYSLRSERIQISLRVHFENGLIGSSATIDVDAVGARERADGLSSALLRVLEPYRTINRWFNPRVEVVGWMIACAITLLLFAFTAEAGSLVRRALLGVASLIVFYASIGNFLFPATTFDSALEDVKKKIRTWFFTGLATAVVFGSLFIFFRQSVFGF